MITARMYPCQLSLNELGKLEDMHAQGADPDDFTIRWSSLMERFRLCEDIVSAGKRGHTSSSVGVRDQGILGPRHRRGDWDCTPLRRRCARGASNTGSTTCAQKIVAEREADDLKNRQSPALRDPLHYPGGPRRVRATNGC